MKRCLPGADKENSYDSAYEDRSHGCVQTTIPKEILPTVSENLISDTKKGNRLRRSTLSEKTDQALQLTAIGKQQKCESLEATAETSKPELKVLEVPRSSEVINAQNERDELPHLGSEKSIDVSISAELVKTDDGSSVGEKLSDCENASLLLNLPKTEQCDKLVKSNPDVTEHLQQDADAGGVSIPLVVLCQPDNTCQLLDNDLMQECIDSPRTKSGKSPHKEKTHDDTFVFDHIQGTVYMPDSASKLQTKTKCMIVLFALLAIAIVLIVGFLIP